ncbi:DUF6134 family protein [Roseovarius nitratireducens]|uniref:DUF6134 family protein n=1 Tax=Roseovarius nitratireducens TaxID=2044597 RepID=UPI000CE248AD|nr:DUF6134 family protein [Roseovarius nitratireducens]
MRILSLAAGLILALAPSLNAASIPAGGHLEFDVVRKGKDIGDHGYRFNGSDDALTVKVTTDITVKVPIISVTAYRFQHQSVENWSGGTLTSVRSATNDDGTPHQLTTGGKGVLPASLWNDDILRAGKLLNTIDGSIMSVRVSDMGTEQVTTRRGPVATHHYRLSGDLNRDLWYDAQGNLAHVSFTAEDGTTVTYVRK